MHRNQAGAKEYIDPHNLQSKEWNERYRRVSLKRRKLLGTFIDVIIIKNDNSCRVVAGFGFKEESWGRLRAVMPRVYVPSAHILQSIWQTASSDS